MAIIWALLPRRPERKASSWASVVRTPSQPTRRATASRTSSSAWWVSCEHRDRARARAVDLGVPRTGVADRVRERVFEEELVLVTAFALPRFPDAAQLSAVPFLAFRQGCSYRQRIELLLAARGELDEGKRKAEGDIAHAMKVASKHNYNGAGCRA